MLKIKIDFWKLAQVAEANPENYAALREAQPELPETLEALKKSYTSFEHWINSADDLPAWVFEVATFEKPKVLEIIKSDGRTDLNKLKIAVELNQVHLPGNELLKFKRLKALESPCTERVNDEMANGWHLIAVLPQFGQRRPDYILGNYEGDK